MQLHLSNTDDGYMLWGAFLRGKHNDGDGGYGIYHEWFMVARTEEEVRRALAGIVDAKKNTYNWYDPSEATVAYRPVSPMELVLCSRAPGGNLNPVTLANKTPAGFSITPALMDTRE